MDQRSYELVQDLENKLDILQKRVEVKGDSKSNYIKEIAFHALRNTRQVGIPKNEAIVIDAPALYILFYLGEKKWLEDNTYVIVTFSTIEKLHNLYCNCGDPLLFEIIEEIKNAENVKLVSPSMESIPQSKKKFQR